MAVSLICWALWPCGCQSDMLGFGGHVAVSLICWALWLYGCQSDMWLCVLFKMQLHMCMYADGEVCQVVVKWFYSFPPTVLTGVL